MICFLEKQKHSLWKCNFLASQTGEAGWPREAFSPADKCYFITRAVYAVFAVFRSRTKTHWQTLSLERCWNRKVKKTASLVRISEAFSLHCADLQNPQHSGDTAKKKTRIHYVQRSCPVRKCLFCVDKKNHANSTTGQWNRVILSECQLISFSL